LTAQNPSQILGLALVRGLISYGDIARAMESCAGEGAAEILLWLDSSGVLGMEQQSLLAQEVLPAPEPEGPPPVAWQPSPSAPPPCAGQFKTATVLPSWGHYRNLRFIGEGGMGRIFQAYDPSLRRVVALKILRGDSPELILRFLLEAQNQAAVEHPNICRVYEVGEWQGYSYIAMQFIVGEALDMLAPRLSLEQKVEVTRTVAEAIHAAHALGLVHRDIKPANIMVEREGNGRLRPYVLDFGLSRGPDASGLTVTGLVLGTTHYMAPEQARGEHRLVDRRTDVYSLGATLYRALSGRPPFGDSEFPEGVAGSQSSELVSLRRLASDLPRDLCAIVEKAMEREPEDRYPSAEAFAEDLRRFQEGEPTLAGTHAFGYRALKFLRKRKYAFLSAASVLVAVLVFGGMAVGARLRASEQIRLAQQLALESVAIEAQVRYIHLLPMHNVQTDMAQVRRLVERMQERGSRPGRAAQGPIAYALGRASLAGGDPKSAMAHLEEAWNHGYGTPDVAYCTAMALIRISCRPGAASPAEVARIVSCLRGSRGATLESIFFIEAQLAFYEGRMDQAADLAQRALLERPWLYEARALQARIQMAKAASLGEERAVLQRLAAASEHLEIALAMAPCDPSLRDLMCCRYEQELAWRRERGLDQGPALRALEGARALKSRLQPTS